MTPGRIATLSSALAEKMSLPPFFGGAANSSLSTSFLLVSCWKIRRRFLPAMTASSAGISQNPSSGSESSASPGTGVCNRSSGLEKILYSWRKGRWSLGLVIRLLFLVPPACRITHRHRKNLLLCFCTAVFPVFKALFFAIFFVLLTYGSISRSKMPEIMKFQNKHVSSM
jgi:hypothetical protein